GHLLPAGEKGRAETSNPMGGSSALGRMNHRSGKEAIATAGETETSKRGRMALTFSHNRDNHQVI
ncbi:hypothetical protein, partial [Shinella sp.]|uniref:hypothetical protein n=1 Tax=Shinella sp. TaxID=1870904 RepID=UPI00301DF743